MESVITVNQLGKSFGKICALNDVSFSIEKGKLVGLLGTNGAGKTTLIKILTCLILPTCGDAKILGYDIVKEANIVKSLIGISPQETSVAPLLSVRENIEFMCEIYGIKGEKLKNRTVELLSDFSLNSVADRLSGKLSGGYQRRLSIAMALVNEPKVLFLDEPTLGLDVISRRTLWQDLRALKGEITTILTTHYLEEAEALSDDIIILDNGKVKTKGTPKSIIESVGANNFEDAFIRVVGGVL